ncbi:MAG: hypothetical protein AAGF02_20975 [Actinomycetota bacterium]
MRRSVIVVVGLLWGVTSAVPASAAESAFELPHPGTTATVIASDAADVSADGSAVLMTGTFGTSVVDEDGQWFPPDPIEGDQLTSPRGTDGRLTNGGDEVLLVTSEAMLGDAASGSQVYAIDRRTDAVTLVSTDGGTTSIFSMDASADGSLVVYSRSRTGASSADLWVVDRGTGSVSKLAGAGSITESGIGVPETNGSVRVAADGSLVAWVATALRTVVGSDDGKVASWRPSDGAVTLMGEPFIARGLDVADDGSAALVIGSTSFDAGYGLYRARPGDAPVLVAADGNDGGACWNGAVRRPHVAGDGVVWARVVEGGCELVSTTLSSGATETIVAAGGPRLINASGHLRSADGTVIVSPQFENELGIGRTVVLGESTTTTSEAVDIDYSADGARLTVTYADGLDRSGSPAEGADPLALIGPSLRPGERVVAREAVPGGSGHWLFTDLGRVLPMDGAPFFDDLRGLTLNGGVIDAVATPSGEGYYMVGTDGGVFSFGDAEFFGSMGGQPLNGPVNGLAPTPTGRGYWLVADDGGIFAFGDAEFFGSMGGRPLNAPMGGIINTP